MGDLFLFYCLYLLLCIYQFVLTWIRIAAASKTTASGQILRGWKNLGGCGICFCFLVCIYYSVFTSLYWSGYALQQPQKQQLVGKSSEVGKNSEDGGFVFVLLSVFITLYLTSLY